MKKIDISPAGHGHFKISTIYYGKVVSAITTNTKAIDRYRDDGPATKNGHYKTQNKAAAALYAEITITRQRRTVLK